MNVLLRNFENLETKYKCVLSSWSPGRDYTVGVYTSPFIQAVFHVQLGKGAFCVSSLHTPRGEKARPVRENKHLLVCVCVCVCVLRSIKPPDPHSGVGADIRELLTVPQCDLLHNARDSSAA